MKLTEDERATLKALGETDESLDEQERAFTEAAERPPIDMTGWTRAQKDRFRDKFGMC